MTSAPCHTRQDHVEGANFCSTVHSVHPSLPIKPFGYFWSQCLERILFGAGRRQESRALFGANSALRTTTRSPRQKKMKMIGAAALLACAGVAVAQDGACSPQQLRCRACLLGAAASPPFAAASPGAPRAGGDRAGGWSSGGRGCERAGAAPRRTPPFHSSHRSSLRNTAASGQRPAARAARSAMSGPLPRPRAAAPACCSTRAWRGIAPGRGL